MRVGIAYWLERDTLLRSLKTALIIGTLLALINHGQQILSGQFALAWVVPMLITYLVPFCVATYGQVQAKRQRDRLRTDRASLSHKAIDITTRRTAPVPATPVLLNAHMQTTVQKQRLSFSSSPIISTQFSRPKSVLADNNVLPAVPKDIKTSQEHGVAALPPGVQRIARLNKKRTRLVPTTGDEYATEAMARNGRQQ